MQLACILLLCLAARAQQPAPIVSDRMVTLHREVMQALELYPQRALQYALKAQRASSSASRLLQYQALIDLSTCYRYAGRPDSALRYARLSLRQANGLMPDSLKARAYSNYGNILFSAGVNDTALYYQLQSLKIREALDFKPDIIHSLYNLGAISNSVGDSAQAFRYFNTCLKTAQQLNDPALLALASEGMASWYYFQGGSAKATEFYRQSERLYTQVGKVQGSAQCLLNLGTVYDEAGQSAESIRCYLTALPLFEKMGMKDNVLLCYSNLGATYIRLGNPDLGLHYIHRALPMAKALNYREALSNIYENISSAYRLKSNADSALKYFELYSLLNDSILDLEKRKDIDRLQEEFNMEKREQEIKSLKEQERLKDEEVRLHKRQKLLLIVSLALLAVLLLLVYFIFRQRARNAKMLAEKNEQLYRKQIHEIIKEQELKSIDLLMEAQTSERKRIAEDLHDRLGSMLAAIKLNFSALENKVDKLELKSAEQYNRANKLLDDVCNEVRKIAHNMDSGTLANFGLVPALNDLKEALRNTGDLEILLNTFGMNERLESDLEITVYRIIQELLSNVIKHARATKVNIDLNRSSEQLTVIFSDNGIGYTTDANDKSGMGLKNISSRISRLGGKFYVDSGNNNGTTTILEIPLNDDQSIIGG